MSRRKHLFSFRQFDIRQEKSPFKVGTDGVLLGAWAGQGTPNNILDIGTGTGLVALMLAQRFPDAWVCGLELQVDAVEEAAANTRSSPFAHRIEILHADFLEWQADGRFDLIVSNPPYFKNSLPPSHQGKHIARHQESLSIDVLMEKSYDLLSEEGTLCLILPVDIMSDAETKAEELGLHPSRKCDISSMEGGPAIRIMQEWGRKQLPQMQSFLHIYQGRNEYSDAYRSLTQDFYPWM